MERSVYLPDHRTSRAEPHRRWTTTEDIAVRLAASLRRQGAAEDPLRDVARRLRRSYQAVLRRARELRRDG